MAGLGFLIIGLTFHRSLIWVGSGTSGLEARADLNTQRRQGGSATRLTRFGLRGVLVTAQIALSLLLLIAGLFLRSLRNAVTDPGFDNHNLCLHRRYRTSVHKTQLNPSEEVVANLKSEPGVRSVGLSGVVPLSGGGERRNIYIQGINRDPMKTLS